MNMHITCSLYGWKSILLSVFAAPFLLSTTCMAATLTVTAPANGYISGHLSTNEIININCGSGGTKCVATIAAGTTEALQAIPNSGYSFASWTATVNGQPWTTPNTETTSFSPIAAVAAITVTATFNKIPPVDGVCGLPEINNYSVFAPVAELCSAGTATAVTGGTATWDWNCDGSYGGTNASCSTPRKYYLSYFAGTGGLLNIMAVNTISVAQHIAYNGTAISVTAVPDSNYLFSNWTEGAAIVSTSPTLDISGVTASHGYIANFTAVNLFISPKPVGGTVTSVEAGINCGDNGDVCQAAYMPGAQFSLVFVPESPNYTLEYWTINGNIDLPDNPITYTMVPSGAITVSAQTLHHPMVNGVCGADNLMIIPTAPVNLCTSGMILPVTGTGPWNWGCGGSYGGVTVTCSAKKLVFTPLASTATDRRGHTTTLLQNGKLLVAGGVDKNGNVLASTEIYDPTTNIWTSSGIMPDARSEHTAVSLPSGIILISGGRNASNSALASAELYDPASNRWTSAPHMPTTHAYHTATLLNNGTVLVAGGDNITTIDSAELYDPVSNSWSYAGSMTTPRSNHTAVLLANGTVFVAGGSNLESTELYNPQTNTWTPATSMTIKRTHHTATLLPNGKVLIAGGTLSNGESELYDPGTDSWSSAGLLGNSRVRHSATLLPNGKLLVTGGHSLSQTYTSAELYDPATNSWSDIGDMAVERFSHTATLMPDGRIILIGGPGIKLAESYDSAVGSWTATASMTMTVSSGWGTMTLLADGKVLVVSDADNSPSHFTSQIFNPATQKWASAGNTLYYRKNHTATLLPNGNVLIVGGYTDYGSVYNTIGIVEKYTPASSGNPWSYIPNANVARTSHTATLLPNGKVLILGGEVLSGSNHFGATKTTLSSAVIYDPTADTLSTAAGMSTARSHHTATLLQNGKILVAGGDATMSCELYDPATDTWAPAASLPYARASHTAVLLPSGKVLIVGGNFASAQLYDPVSNAWTSAGSLAEHINGMSVQLLPNGKVLVAGGENSSYTVTATSEIYDPATNSWSLGSDMTTPRFGHFATLLGNGKMLVAGRNNGSGTSAELYDPGLGFNDSRRPIITSATIAAPMPTQLVLTGSGFRGDSEVSSGNSASSSSGYPLVQLQRLDNQQLFYVHPAQNWQWSNATFVSTPLTGIPGGHYRVTVFVNGIPSLEKIVSLNVHSVGFTAGVGGSLSSNSSQYILDGGVATPVQAIPDPGYAFVNWTSADGLITIPLNPLPGSTITADMKITANFAIAPINGVCGSSNHTYSATKPVTGLCAVGNESPVNGTGPWNWSCSGLFTGTTATCSTTAPPTLQILFSGDGSGSISSSPAGISCGSGGACPTAAFIPGTKITLTASPGIYSEFGGWDACPGFGTCTITMDTSKNVTASFARAPLIKNQHSGAVNSLLQDAYNTASSGDTLMLRINPSLLTGGLNMNRPAISSLIIKGGYTAAFDANPGFTSIQGPLKITSGSLIIERVIITP